MEYHHDVWGRSNVSGFGYRGLFTRSYTHYREARPSQLFSATHTSMNMRAMALWILNPISISIHCQMFPEWYPT